GKLAIETTNVDVDSAMAFATPGARAGSFVRLTVTDTGTGMTEEIRRQVFQPFFTTKPEGKGTGLGLAIVYSIVKQNNGFVEVRSEPGRGATFEVFFPEADQATTAAAAQPARAFAAMPTRGSATILVVEDED